jgi:hypothetical protein
MTKISELPNTHTYPLRALAELRRRENTDPVYGTQKTWNTRDAFEWDKTLEKHSFWRDVFCGETMPIPASSLEDLRRAGMMPEPFLCKIRHYGTPCEKQCAECAVDAQAARKHNDALTNGTFVPPSITLSDYARMEREEEAITSPAHYKVCEGLDVVDMIRAVLTPEQFKGYCLGNLIKYRMRAGKKTMSPMEDLGKAHVYETWLAEMEGGED